MSKTTKLIKHGTIKQMVRRKTQVKYKPSPNESKDYTKLIVIFTITFVVITIIKMLCF